MSAVRAIPAEFTPAEVPLWREVLFGVDWVALRLSPVYYGIGVPRGDGDPVVVLPGFLGSDSYLAEMHYWLKRIGYRSYYSRIGRNAECPDVLTDRLFETIDQAHADTDRKVHLIGHSLGGLIARSAAIRRPEQVAQVISLAAPFRDIRAHPMILAAAGLVRNQVVGRRRKERTSSGGKRACFTGACSCDFASSLRSDGVDSVEHSSIYTETDGVVDWRSCVEEESSKNTKVSGTHTGLAFNPQVYRRIANLLAAR